MGRRRIHFAPWQKPYPKARLSRAAEFLRCIAERIEQRRLYYNKLPHADVDFVHKEFRALARAIRLKAQNIRRKRDAS